MKIQNIDLRHALGKLEFFNHQYYIATLTEIYLFRPFSIFPQNTKVSFLTFVER